MVDYAASLGLLLGSIDADLYNAIDAVRSQLTQGHQLDLQSRLGLRKVHVSAFGAPKMLVVPGDRLDSGSSAHVSGGRGTYSTQDGVFASVVGRVVTSDEGKRVEVVSSCSEKSEVLPSVGSQVTGRVTKVTTKLCEIAILVVGEQPVRGTNSFKGILRKENVRAFEVDQIDIFDCFRFGDIVVANVAALGGARSYELTTAENHLGVLHAICSTSGKPMLPASWVTMRCPVTGVIEKRKVAKSVG